MAHTGEEKRGLPRLFQVKLDLWGREAGGALTGGSSFLIPKRVIKVGKRDSVKRL